MTLKNSLPVEMGKGDLGRWISLVFVFLLIISSQKTFGQVVFDCDGGYHINRGHIDTASVSGGEVNNYGTIDKAVMKGGVVNNSGSIKEMTYYGGTYNGYIEDWVGENGSIGTLTIAGQLDTSNNWGTIENVKFNGGSILFVVDFNGLFSRLDVRKVNFDGANILFDLTALANFEDDLATYFLENFGSSDRLTNLLADSFGIDIFTDSTGWLNSITLTGDDYILEKLAACGFIESWDRDPITGGFVTYGVRAASVVPEPAAVLMLSFGLAGVGLASRRRRK